MLRRMLDNVLIFFKKITTFRSESVEGFLSPSRCGSRNGEKDWENASTTSSVASATEYTGLFPGWYSTFYVV